jgi:hypothetical protein
MQHFFNLILCVKTAVLFFLTERDGKAPPWPSAPLEVSSGYFYHYLSVIIARCQ